jgi:hypothetical protein
LGIKVPAPPQPRPQARPKLVSEQLDVFGDLDDIIDVEMDVNQMAAAHAVSASLAASYPGEEKQEEKEEKEEKEEERRPPPKKNGIVRVKPAHDLPGKRNKGLYAMRKITNGTVVARYGGEKISEAESDNVDPAYLITDDHNQIWNGDPATGRADIGVFANDNRHRFNYNVEYQTADGPDGGIVLVAKGDINKGVEILVDYGAPYWQAAAERVQPKRKRPAARPAARPKGAKRPAARPKGAKQPAAQPKRAGRPPRQGPRMARNAQGESVPAWKIAQQRRIDKHFGGSTERWKEHRRLARARQRAQRRQEAQQ